MAHGSATPSEIVGDGMHVDVGVRRSFDIEVDARTLQYLTELLAPASVMVERELGLAGLTFEGPGCLQYPPGGFYRPHRDVMPAAAGAEWPRRISLVLFVTGGPAHGGELRLHHAADRWRDVAPERGTLVAFPAEMIHEVRPVRAGLRQTVVDWLS
jgi:predicted 2-oxoglutarate/Fe(II)-dependent dioxygenase YbiX